MAMGSSGRDAPSLMVGKWHTSTCPLEMSEASPPVMLRAVWLGHGGTCSPPFVDGAVQVHGEGRGTGSTDPVTDLSFLSTPLYFPLICYANVFCDENNLKR